MIRSHPTAQISLFIVCTCLLLVMSRDGGAEAACSSAYGAKPCPYVPSPPGEKPPCARYGDTFCEYPEHYPKDLVYDLVEKWKYNHQTLFLNEDEHDYGYYPSSNTPSFTTPSTGSTFNSQPDSTPSYPKPVYGPPTRTYPSLNTYIPPPPAVNSVPVVNRTQNYYGTINSHPSYQQQQHVNPPKFGQFSQQFHYNSYKKQPFGGSFGAPSFSRFNSPSETFKAMRYQSGEGYFYNPWMKWNGRSDKFNIRKRRDLARKWYHQRENSTLMARSKRDKRQTMVGQITGQTLCQTRSQYIMPRAALNRKGDWMYVVNLPEVNQRFTQLVKSEICSSQQCNGLCSIPTGFKSRCEQKYVQKRLVAVDPGGSQLYSDVFWFPSCCLCTITSN